jgi:hypothetical protein
MKRTTSLLLFSALCLLAIAVRANEDIDLDELDTTDSTLELTQPIPR